MAVPSRDSGVGSVAVGTEELFREHARYVARFAYRLGVSAHDIDDFVQDVFVTVHRAGGYRPGTATPRTWLGQIALRLVVARRRRWLRRAKLQDEELVVVGTAPDPQTEAEVRESLERVQSALDTIAVEKRMVLILHELEGEAPDAIAAALGVPVGTVYSRLHHARIDFKKAYRQQLAIANIARNRTGEL